MIYKDIKISIIVPVYNKEKYLPQCIDSLLNQTHPNIEILLVENDSTDNAPKICLEYAEKHPNIIRYFSQKGLGSAGARNLGIKESKGEYITFVDCDDYIDYEMCEILLNYALATHADITFGNTVGFGLLGSMDFRAPITHFINTFIQRFNAYYSAVHAKLYLKSYLQKYNLYFKEGIIIDDLFFFMKECYYPSNIFIAPKTKPLYFWRVNETSYSLIFNKYYKNMSVILLSLIEEFDVDNNLLDNLLVDKKTYNFSTLNAVSGACVYFLEMMNNSKEKDLTTEEIRAYCYNDMLKIATKYNIDITGINAGLLPIVIKKEVKKPFKIPKIFLHPIGFITTLLKWVLPYYILKRLYKII